jgi:succinate dehydrogenase/fumarate reductase-like Fe-S protein
MTKRIFEIYRYDPDKDAKPYMQSIEVELDGHERMLARCAHEAEKSGSHFVVSPLMP